MVFPRLSFLFRRQARRPAGAGLCSVFAVLGLLALPRGAEARRYTLEQLLDKVRHDYPGVSAAEASVDAAKAQLAQAQRTWMPSGDLTFWITGAPNVQCTGPADPITGVIPSPASDKAVREGNCVNTGVSDYLKTNNNLVDALPFHGVALNLSFNLIQPLYTFGKIESATAAAHAAVDGARGMVEKERLEVVWMARRAYYGLKWTRATKDILDDALDRLKKYVDQIDEDLNGDNKHKYTETDLARMKLAYDYAAIQLLDAQRGYELALAGIRVLADDPEADTDEEELDFSDVVDKPVSFYEDEARLHRPEARLLDVAVRGAQAWTRWKRSEMLPDLGLASYFTYALATSVDNPSNAFLSHPNALGFTLLLSVKQPLDFGVRYGRLQQARADQAATEARRKQALGGIQIEIAKAYADYEEARGRVEKTAHAEKVARGWYNAIDQTMKAGLTTDQFQLVDASRQYFEFRLRHLQAIFDANVMLAWLRRTTGVE